MWHYVRVEDFEDNADFHAWATTKTEWHIDNLVRDLSAQYANPQMVCVRNVPARDTLWDRMYWIEYVSVYDELESTELLGFAYIPALYSNADIERDFISSHVDK